MSIRTASVVCAVVLFGCAAGIPVARAQDNDEIPRAHQDSRVPRSLDEGWRFALGTYLWTTALNGDATVMGQTFDVDASFIDVLQATDSLLAFDLPFVARKGKWGFLIDPLYMKIGASSQGPMGNIDVNVTARIVIIETTGFYTFLQKTPGGSSRTTISIDAILGLRIWWIGLKANGSNGVFSQEGSQAWVDPLAGLFFRFDLARGHVPILVRGDFGGWGVGSSIAWAATASVGYRWLLRRLDVGLDLAYRALGPNYSNSSEGVGWNVVMHGPALAVMFEF